MSRLPIPVRSVLRSGLDEVALARVGRRVAATRRAASTRVSGPALRETPSASAYRWRPIGALLGAAVAVVVALAVVSAHRAREGSEGPLRTADGRSMETMGEASQSPRTFFLTDGSIVTLIAGARLQVLENDGTAIVALLGSGSARFDVQPGGPRRWTIECGVASVQVVGTRFSIQRAPGQVRVGVEHGTVIVRSDQLPERVQKLTDGQTLDVTEASAPMPRSPAPALSETVDASALSLPLRAVRPTSDKGDRARAVGRGASGAGWRELARRGEYAAAYALLGTSGIGDLSTDGTVADSLAAADVARLSGHPRDAVAPLQHIVTVYPDDPRAALAAFTLGRVQLDALEDAADAADAFARAIVLGVPDGLLEDAYARLVEARARAGDRAGARRAAQTYRERFPDGTRGPAIDRWLGGP
jgi:transmembrane sensor